MPDIETRARELLTKELGCEPDELWLYWHGPQHEGDSALRAITRALSGREGGEEDWVAAAAMYTLDNADAPPAVRSEWGEGIEHASWMLIEIINRRIAGRKAHRWLGYAQGLLVAAQWLTLEEAKQANKRASDEVAALPQTEEARGGPHD